MSSPRVTRGKGLLEGFLARRRIHQARKVIPRQAAGGRVLDVGCGSFPLFLMSSDFAEKYGLDRLLVTLPEGVRAPNLMLLQHDVQSGRELPFPSDHFDVVTMLAVFEHLEPRVLSQLVSEIRRVLKPAGVYVLTTPAHWTDPLLTALARVGLVSSSEIDEHQQTYRHRDIRAVLEGAGFSGDRIRLGYFELGMNMWASAAK